MNSMPDERTVTEKLLRTINEWCAIKIIMSLSHILRSPHILHITLEMTLI